MELSTENLNHLCSIAIEAAQQASEYIASSVNSDFTIESKDGGESYASQIFTEVDLKSQEIILSHIRGTISEFDLGLLTEESEDNNSRFTKDYFWCIDPLDGTLPFTESTPGYSVSIALVSKSGIPVIGVIADPTTNNIYHAITKQGAFKNNKPWVLELPKTKLTLVCDRSFLKHSKFQNTVEKLDSLAKQQNLNGTALIHQGGAAMNAIWVIENQPACYIKYPKNTPGGGSLWDYAASTCIFNELDVYATNFFGKKLDLNRKDSTFMNHEGAIFASSKEIHDFIIAKLAD